MILLDPIALRKALNNSFAPLNPFGIPFANNSRSFTEAAALNLEADIPLTSSESGSRSPADTTFTDHQ